MKELIENYLKEKGYKIISWSYKKYVGYIIKVKKEEKEDIFLVEVLVTKILDKELKR
jgi:hypothetical protein